MIRLIPSFNNMSTALSLVKYHSVSHKLLLKEFKKFSKPRNKTNIKKNNFNTNVFKKRLFLDNLSYSYPLTNKEVLKNISIKIEPNTSIAPLLVYRLRKINFDRLNFGFIRANQRQNIN